MVSKVWDWNSTSGKLSCKSNFFLFSCGNSTTVTYRVLRGDYGLHNRQTTSAIRKIVNKFEETELVTNIERPVHHRFALFSENIAIASESVAETRMCRLLVVFRN